MALPYKVWTEEEVESRNVTPKGNYLFQIVLADLKKTKGGLDENGNPKDVHDMLVLDFNYWDKNNVQKRIKDWIVFVDQMDWKLRHLAKAVGLLELYEKKELDARHLIKKKGIFQLGIKDYIDNHGEVKNTNFVKDYVKKLDEIKTETGEFINDRIPF